VTRTLRPASAGVGMCPTDRPTFEVENTDKPRVT
jgi:hypothetical protein